MARTAEGKASAQETREQNRRLVLQEIYEQARTSRADVARVTGLAGPTVSSLVGDLIDAGFVAEVGMGPSAGGKPPRLVSLVDGARLVACLDLSGPDFEGALVDLRGRVVRRARVATGRRTRGVVPVTLVHRLVDRLLAAADAPVLGIGVGTPGLVDRDGVVLRAANLGWVGVALGAELRERHGLAVSVVNDGHAAAFAEHAFADPGRRNLVLVHVGRGVGAGVVLDGALWSGDGSAMGEIGHVTVVPDGAPCVCGRRGCLETVASVPAVLRTLSRDGAPEPPDGSPSRDDLDRLAERIGAARITEGVAVAAGHLATVLSGVLAALDVHHVVLAGDATHLGDAMRAAVERELRDRVLDVVAASITVTSSALGDDLVVRGAAALLLTEELGLVWR